MTRTAMYEKRDGAKDLPKAAYYRTDYVGVKMWCTAVAVTIAYVLILGLIALCNFEYFVNNLTRFNYKFIF